ncbi:uncharacterized protein LOC121590571 isoform X2 [Anopheles merus]|uniref:uncharacterized protein LOC121590571 isoform X2 n=1 Tax=Anopheles merus TaxID=30066 RepID=UPI001BE4B2B8|nr:uncharacterized protein LOC121590571 isoform X2 [Anopheles merus]
MAASPGSDNNCNIYMPPLGCSVASSHDFSDYQWFTDFGSYRDGVATHQSILSALSASYNGIGELSYYEKMAKDIDANLAEIDMESFRKEDINSLLTAIPTQLRLDDAERRTRNNNRIFSTITSCTAAGLIPADMMDNSFCKSEILFSPVKESHISVDSLDMDGYPDEEDIILTCQANKDNYTIAFEQSILYSEESYYDGPEHYGKYKRMNILNNLQSRTQFIRQKESMSRSEVNYTTWSNLKRNVTTPRPPITVNPLITHISRHNRTCFVRKSFSMPNLQSEQSCSLQQVQLPSHERHQLNVSQAANGNNSDESFDRPMRTLLPMCTIPTDSENESSTNGNEVNDSEQSAANEHITVQEHRESLLQAQQLQEQQPPQQQTLQQPSFNLVKLFIKQKSSSTDTCMDVSSGCWPSDSTNSGGSGDHQIHHLGNGTMAARCRKKSMHDSGKCSTTGGGSIGGRQGEEDEFQLDSLDAQINNAHVNANNNNGSDGGEDDPNEERGPPSSPQRAHGMNGGSVPGHMKLNDFNRQMHGSPRRQYKGFSMNIGGRRLLQDLLQQHNGSCAGSASPLNSSTSINNNNNNNSHNVNNNNSYKDTNSDTSRTSENLTQIFNHSGNNNTTTSTGSKTKIPIDMITKSMQTSLIGAPTANGGTATREKVRVIPPSFLDRLNELGDKQKAPVFVVYPNYALPDLGFLKTQNEVVISPLSFKETMTGAGRPLKKPRPVSMNDIENIRQREYKHVTDWKSLVFLLPTEYRKLLRHIPEVGELSMSTEKQPMFCMTPPLRRGVARGVSCDCTNLLQQNTQTYNSSSSGGSSSAAPSSGYRGSSTMLTTDSEMDGILAPSNSSNLFNNNLYVYQYDSPAEVLVPCERPPSGRTAGVAPKSILRRPQGSVRGASNSSGSGANSQSNMKAKRSSMFEEQQGPHFPQGSREKRRSLQEHHSYNFYEDAEEEEEEKEDYEEHRNGQKLHNSPNMIPHPRLTNTPKLPSADHYHKLNKLVEINDNDMANLAHGKHQQCVDEDLEARARAEQFLSHVPKSELKHYAEIAHILESTEMIESSEPPYDRTRLRNEVSRLLSQKRSVAFTKQQTTPTSFGGNNTTPVRQQAAPATALLRPTEIKFSTPPNSPNMSVTVAKTGHHVAGGMMAEKKPPVAQRTPSSLAGSPACGTEKEKQDKIQTNRFKRLQIQWELLSKESTKASSESQRKEIRSGGNTPTGGNGGPKSRIPRPVSYPTTRTNSDPVVSKTLKSPSRIVAPRKYGAMQSPVTTPPTPAPRTPSKTFSNVTPKKVSSAPSRIPLGNRSKKIPAK